MSRFIEAVQLGEEISSDSFGRALVTAAARRSACAVITLEEALMKTIPIVLIAAFVASGYAQAQEAGREDRAVARACKDDAQHLCSGKTGQELQQCLKSNQAQLSSNCKEAVSKLPNPPKS